jgi:hypothetical protein
MLTKGSCWARLPTAQRGIPTKKIILSYYKILLKKSKDKHWIIKLLDMQLINNFR